MEAVKVASLGQISARAVPGRRAVPAEHVSAGALGALDVAGPVVVAGRRKPVLGAPGAASMRRTARADRPGPESRASRARAPRRRSGSRPGRPRHGRRGGASRMGLRRPGLEPGGSGGRRRRPARDVSATVSARGRSAPTARSGSPSRASMASRAASRSSSGSRPSPSIDGRISMRIVPGIGTIAPFGIERRAPWMTAGTSGMPPRAAATNAPMWNRLSPTTESNVPSGKNTSEWPCSARCITRRASRCRPPAE